jgi:hypothetical protein
MVCDKLYVVNNELPFPLVLSETVNIYVRTN